MSKKVGDQTNSQASVALKNLGNRLTWGLVVALTLACYVTLSESLNCLGVISVFTSEDHAEDEMRCYTWHTWHSVWHRLGGQNIRDDEDGDDDGRDYDDNNDGEDDGGDVTDDDGGDGGNEDGDGHGDDDDFVDLLLKMIYTDISQLFIFLFRGAVAATGA